MTTMRATSVALAFLAVAASGAWAQGAPRARLIRVQGTARIMRGGGGQWAPARMASDLLLYTGDHVQAGQQSYVTISIDGSLVVLGPGAHAVVPSRQQVRTRRGFVSWLHRAGQAIYELVGSSGMEIGAEGAIAGADGTKFLLEVTPAGLIILTVLEGQVHFYNDLGAEVVRAGEQSQATRDTAPTRPQQVDVSGLQSWEATLGNLGLGWEAPYRPGLSRPELERQSGAAQGAADQAPGDAARQLEAGEYLDDLGDLKAAEDRYRGILQATPGDAAARRRLGYNLVRQGQAEEAYRAFSEALAGDAADRDAQVGQALALAAAGDPVRTTRAREQLDALLRAEPGHVSGLVASALLAARANDGATAEPRLREALRIAPGHPQALAYLAAVELSKSNLDAARQAATQAVRNAPASALARGGLAQVEFYAGEAAAARRDVDAALALDPASAVARLLSANLYIAAGEVETGVAEAQLAVTLDPTLGPAYRTLGMVFLARNELKQAEKAFGNALRCSPNLVAAQAELGATYLRQGRLDEALAMQTAAVALDRGDAAAHNNLGVTYLAIGRLAEARAEFAEAIRLQPNWGLAHANLALAHLELNEYAQAAGEAERAVALGERSARLYTTLGRVYLKQNRTQMAWAVLRQARELDPEYASARIHLAEVDRRLSRPRDALRETLVAVAEQPSAVLDGREYARTVLRGAAGDDFSLRARTEGRGDRGQNSYFLAAEHLRGDWDREHSDFDQTTVLAIAGRQTTHERTHSLVASGQWDQRDRPGLAMAGGAPEDPDYESRFTGAEGHYLDRRGLHGGTLILRLGYRDASQRESNPDSLDPDPKPYRDIRLAFSGPMFEARLDRLCGDGDRLVGGVALSDQDRDLSGTVGVRNPPGSVPPATFTPFSDSESRTVATLYLDYDRKLSERTRLLVGGRVAAADGMSPVWRPRVSLRHRASRNGTLVLLTRPVLSDDVSELSPVEQWSLTDWLSPLDLSRGGYSQSYEAQYEVLVGGGALARLAVFHRDLRNLLVDLQDPALSAGVAPVVISSGSLQGVMVEAERPLGRDLSGGVQFAWMDSDNDDTGADLPYQPEIRGQGRLDYLAYSGWRAALVLDFIGRRFADLAATTELGSVTVLSLTVAKQHDLHTDAFLTIGNLFDEESGFWLGYPSAGRRINAGVEYRF